MEREDKEEGILILFNLDFTFMEIDDFLCDR